MKDYKDRESSLDNGLTDFLVKKYGHNGDPPPK